jgi:RNA polymerase sigma factor (sigma-70 family)
MTFGFRQLSDEEIIRRIREGDEKVLLALYKRNIEPVRSLVMKNSGQIADAEDLLQETLVAIWQKAARPEFELTARLDTLIYAIARNLWLKQLRKQGRLTATAFEDGDMDLPEAEVKNEEEGDQSAVLAKYMEQLGSTCRELLSLFYYEQWDMEKIAEKMGFANADTAKAKKYQCKKKLEDLIRQHYKKGDFF